MLNRSDSHAQDCTEIAQKLTGLPLCQKCQEFEKFCQKVRNFDKSIVMSGKRNVRYFECKIKA